MAGVRFVLWGRELGDRLQTRRERQVTGPDTGSQHSCAVASSAFNQLRGDPTSRLLPSRGKLVAHAVMAEGLGPGSLGRERAWMPGLFYGTAVRLAPSAPGTVREEARARPGLRLLKVNLGEGTAEVHAQVARPIVRVPASALGAVIRPR